MQGPTGAIPGPPTADPWAPSAGYPPGQGPSGQQPPPDPQAVQTAQNVGTGAPPPQTTPQPPTVDPSQKSPPGFSLNDVAANLQDKPELDLGQRFKTYYELIKGTLPDAERPHLDESTKPGLLANLVTFGMAGAMDHDYRQAYNAAVDKHNADLHGAAMKNALSMVADDVKQHSGDIGTQIRLLSLYQQMQNAKSLDLHRNVMEELRKLEVGISGDRLNIAQQELDRKRTIPAPDEKTRAVLDANGFVFIDDPQNPGRGWAVPKDSPNARFARPPGSKGAPVAASTNPPPANAPADANAPPTTKPRTDLPTSGTTSNGIQYRFPGQAATPNQPTGDMSDPNAPGLTPEERYRRKINKEKTAAQPIPADTAKQISNIDQSISAFDELEKLAMDPTVRPLIGPGMSLVSKGLYGIGLGSGNPKVDNYLQRIAYLRSQAVGPLLHGSRNEKIWQQIQEHLPKESDEPDLALEKIRTAREIYRRNREAELSAASMTRGEAGATAP